MRKIGIFYGSTSGTTADIAKRIAQKAGIHPANIFDVANTSVDTTAPYEVLLLGSSTWNGHLQDNWDGFLSKLKQMDLSNTYVAIFGTGDCVSYSDSFCDAIGIIYRELRDTDCMFCGAVSVEGYTFRRSVTQIGDMFVGLPLDEINEKDLTDQRLDTWIEQITIECLIKPKGYCSI